MQHYDLAGPCTDLRRSFLTPQFVGIFTGTASQHGGQETTQLTTIRRWPTLSVIARLPTAC
jgi:hypothetical protein